MKTLTAKRFHWRKTGALLALAFLSLLAPSTMRADSIDFTTRSKTILLADITDSAESAGFGKNPGAEDSLPEGSLPWIIGLVVFLCACLIVVCHSDSAQDFTKQTRPTVASCPTETPRPAPMPRPMEKGGRLKAFARTGWSVLGCFTYFILPLLFLIYLGWGYFVLAIFLALIPTAMILPEDDSDKDKNAKGKKTSEQEKPSLETDGSQTPEKTQAKTPPKKKNSFLVTLCGFIIFGEAIAVIVILFVCGWIAFLKALAVGIWIFILMSLIALQFDKDP